MLKTSLRIFIILLAGFALQSFGWWHVIPFQTADQRQAPYELEVNLQGEDFANIVSEAYLKFEFGENTLDYNVFVRALIGYFFLKQSHELVNHRYLTVIDFSLSSKARRLWLLDMETRKVVLNELVAHGKNSGEEFATSFSNKINSLQSSVGFFLTGDPYQGKHKFSLKLNGLEAGYNTNAFVRGVVIHGADYVNQDLVSAGQRIGRSYGCPAVPTAANEQLIDLIKGGSCLFIHHPDKRYLQRSRILNNDIFIPIEELRNLLE